MFEKYITCPYCWEQFAIYIEPEYEIGERYIEDCYVCCRPIEIAITSKNDVEFGVNASRIEGNEL